MFSNIDPIVVDLSESPIFPRNRFFVFLGIHARANSALWREGHMPYAPESRGSLDIVLLADDVPCAVRQIIFHVTKMTLKLLMKTHIPLYQILYEHMRDFITAEHIDHEKILTAMIAVNPGEGVLERDASWSKAFGAVLYSFVEIMETNPTLLPPISQNWGNIRTLAEHIRDIVYAANESADDPRAKEAPRPVRAVISVERAPDVDTVEAIAYRWHFRDPVVIPPDS